MNTGECGDDRAKLDGSTTYISDTHSSNIKLNVHCTLFVVQYSYNTRDTISVEIQCTTSDYVRRISYDEGHCTMYIVLQQCTKTNIYI